MQQQTDKRQVTSSNNPQATLTISIAPKQFAVVLFFLLCGKEADLLLRENRPLVAKTAAANASSAPMTRPAGSDVDGKGGHQISTSLGYRCRLVLVQLSKAVGNQIATA